MILKNIKCLVFDFDGTLVDTNHIKRDGFFKISEDEKDGRKIMSKLLSSKIGNRYILIKKYCAIQKLTEEVYSRKVKKYCDYVDSGVINSKVFVGVIELLYFLKENDYTAYINTATPEDNIKKIIHSMQWNNFFESIFGSPNTKIKNLKLHVLNKFQPSEVLIIGDGEDYYESANQTSCSFTPVGEGRGVPLGYKKYSIIQVLNKLINDRK